MKTETPLRAVWRTMKRRCNSPSHISYKYYGGAGIRVCDEWDKSFLAFRTWALNNGYSLGLFIDRINNDGDYSPKNCRWVTPRISANNRSNSFRFKDGKTTQTVANSLGLTRQAIRHRIKNLGMPPEVAASMPKQIGGNVKHFRKHHQIDKWNESYPKQ